MNFPQQCFVPYIPLRLSKYLPPPTCPTMCSEPSSPPCPAEISICTGPVCKKDGSASTYASLTALLNSTEDDASVAPHLCTTGCLGECGNGPNSLVVLDPLPPRLITGLRSASSVANLLQRLGASVDKRALYALSSKDDGDALQARRDYRGAVRAYREALDAFPPACSDVDGGVEGNSPRDGDEYERAQAFDELRVATLCNLSSALLLKGETGAALHAACEAVDRDTGRAAGWRRKAEAHAKLGEKEAAVEAWQIWGRLSGSDVEAEKQVRRLTRRRFFGL